MSRILVPAPPRVEPAPHVLTVAGWAHCSSGLLLGALRLLAEASRATSCSLVWGHPPQALEVGTPSGPQEREAWIEAARRARGSNPVAVGDALVVAVRDPGRTVAGALAIEAGDASSELVAAGARHVLALLSSSDVHIERATAYEALFEIGTQIQAEESNSEAIFALIVERASELLATDVAWLAMVDEPRERLRMRVARGTTTPDFMRMEVRVGTGIGGVALKERRAVAVHDSTIYGNGMPRAVHRALDDEGVTSILCAPMLRDEGMLGALYVGTRKPRDFTEEDASLLSALAAQAAVTIENARLLQELAHKNEALEQAFAIHRLLTDASLAGVGLQRVTLELARLVERDLYLVLHSGSPTCARYPRHPAADCPVEVSGAEALPDGIEAVAVVAGEAELGVLHADGAAPLTPLQRKALEHGATVIALELVKEQAALEVEWRLQGELLEELLRYRDEVPEGLLRRAERFGVDLEAPHRVAVLQPEGGTTASSLLEFMRRGLRHRGHVGALVAQRGERVLVAVADDVRGGPRALLDELQQRAPRAGLHFRGGLSNARGDFSLALREAEGALAMALSAERDTDALVSSEDLGPLRFLLDAPNTHEMLALVTHALGPLAEHDERRQADLLFTLRAYLAAGGHHPTTADRCFIHVSTLKYRLSRISAILGRNLTDPATRFELSLALEVLGVLEAIGAAPFEVATASARAALQDG
jgi:DNA-binding PucR family transcriptional regulator